MISVTTVELANWIIALKTFPFSNGVIYLSSTEAPPRIEYYYLVSSYFSGRRVNKKKQEQNLIGVNGRLDSMSAGANAVVSGLRQQLDNYRDESRKNTKLTLTVMMDSSVVSSRLGHTFKRLTFTSLLGAQNVLQSRIQGLRSEKQALKSSITSNRNQIGNYMLMASIQPTIGQGLQSQIENLNRTITQDEEELEMV